eukprot:UN16187
MIGEDVKVIPDINDPYRCQKNAKTIFDCKFFHIFENFDSTCRLKRNKGKEWGGNAIVSGPKRCP